MSNSRQYLVLALALCLFPAEALAQSISTGPLAPVPVSSPWVLLALGIALIASMWWMQQRQTLNGRGAGFAMLVMGAAVAGALVISAQSTSTFSNPAGETLPVPINPDTSGDDVEGWEPADFTNNSGAALLISAIDAPTMSECFPGGLDGELVAGSSDPSPHPLCAVNNTLANGATCRVDVETICRTAASGNLATLTSISPAVGLARAGTSVTLTGTNLTGATGVTFDGLAATSVVVVNATTVTATTPQHSPGVVDVAIVTPAGGPVLDNAFTYNSGITFTAVNASSGSGAGGVGVTLTGTGFTGATGVTFDGVAATSVNVVNSTTVTAVTPSHAAGAVDVRIIAGVDSGTLANGFTYVATAAGQAAHGGRIAAFGGGFQNLISWVADNSAGIVWGGFGTVTGAQSDTDGATNTTTVLAALGNNGGVPYAAQVCGLLEIDSQGNTPCQPGNACYNDWHLPSKDQLNTLFVNRVAIGGFTGGIYWSSTEHSGVPASNVWAQLFGGGVQGFSGKSNTNLVRCVRNFTQ